MLLPSNLSAYNFQYDNWGAAPGTATGTSVTPGATNAEGSWTQLASSANIAQDCYWMHVSVHSGNTSGQAKNHLLDIGVDPAGGSSYSAIISNIVCGSTQGATGTGVTEFIFPFYIKAGSSVAARIQGSNGTAGTVRVTALFWGQPTRPEAVPVGSFSQTFGTITNSLGESITPGNGSYSSYVDMGAASNPLWWFQFGYQINNSTITAERTFFEIAWGDASNKHLMFRTMHVGTTGETCGLRHLTGLSFPGAYNPVPAGANIYVRARADSAPDTGYNCSIIGIGG